MTTRVPATNDLSGADDTCAESVWQGAVVVGVSMRSGSPAALRWGLAEARRRGVTMVAVSYTHLTLPTIYSV